MSRGVEPLPPDATVQEAALRMAEDDVGAVLVGDASRLVGILTDRDIILRVVVEGRDATSVKVSEVMSADLWTCRPDERVEDAFARMSERQVRRLPVLDAEDRPVGIVTLSDLARAGRDPEEAARLLRDIAEPHRTETRADETDTPNAAS